MARTRSSPARRRDARELARTPVPNPYRHQLADPYTPAAVAPPEERSGAAGRPGSFVLNPTTDGPPRFARDASDNAAETTPAKPRRTPQRKRQRQPRPGYLPGRVPTPPAAGWAVAFGFVLGAMLALFGLLLIAYINLQDQFGPDRSFHAGGDASDLLIGLIDLVLACTLLISSTWLASGRVAGRIGMTIAGWTTLFLSSYWWQSDRNVPTYLPWAMAVAAVMMLMLAYMPAVTRWLGVLPVPQPERPEQPEQPLSPQQEPTRGAASFR